MPLEKIKLQISTPTEPIPAGRGFYQLEDDCLFVQIGQFISKRSFFSYLEADKIHFDIDKTGKLIFFELEIPRRHWEKVESLISPEIIEPADIRWLDFRKGIDLPTLITDKSQSKLKIQFQENGTSYNYYLGETIIAEVNKQNELTAIWVNNISDDFAGQEIRSFRKKNRLSKSYFI
ncbi:hypothetical protein ACFLQG_00615 [Candidatus Zixiibacteriota bacterium]